MMRIATLIQSFLLICVLECRAQEKDKDKLSDEQALAAAEKAFNTGNWNPEIFEVEPITVRMRTVDEQLSGPRFQELKKEMLAKFGNGPFTIVSYKRRHASLSTNGGESYARLSFLVFSPLKVAIIDGRASPGLKDQLPKKGP